MKRPELKSSDFSTYLQAPADAEREPAKDDYSHLAAFCFSAYSEHHERLQSEAVRHGFNVPARLIRYATHLYPEHAKAEGEPVATEDLRTILLNSADTPSRFANMSDNMNRTIEAYFGLRNDTVPADASDIFRFEPNTSRGTIFIADDDAFSRAVLAAEFENSPEDLAVGKKCPMLHVMCSEIWPAMVNLAADTPELIPHDLQSAAQ